MGEKQREFVLSCGAMWELSDQRCLAGLLNGEPFQIGLQPGIPGGGNGMERGWEERLSCCWRSEDGEGGGV